MTTHELKEAIYNRLMAYVAIDSETGTAKENATADFLKEQLLTMAYYKQHPDHCGLHIIPEDPYGRSVAWALVKGKGPKTAVMIHHYDVVGIEDFKRYKQLAFSPEPLMEALAKDPSALSDEAYQDLCSKEWLFGRGTADMKGGGAIQLAFIEAYGQRESFDGNLLMLAVPDEENLSAGMLGAQSLMDRLREEEGLEYVLMINSEPHQRKHLSHGLLSGGSIGKLMPFVYARGILAHAGKSAEGFNPLSLLSGMVAATEMNPELVDVIPEEKEMSPPPTWLMMRDSKTMYDVSMPLSAFGLISVQPLTSGPTKIMGTLKTIAAEVAKNAAERVNTSTELFFEATGRQGQPRKWQIGVALFSEWIKEASLKHGAGFTTHYDRLKADAARSVSQGSKTHSQATWEMIDALLEYTGSEDPILLIGIVPPFYPSVSYRDRADFSTVIQELHQTIRQASLTAYGQDYDLEAYFTGISDLSYTALGGESAAALEATVKGDMPLYGVSYHIPFEAIARNTMPCINIGPWGKDFHKISERVLLEDLLNRTPHLIQCALDKVLA